MATNKGKTSAAKPKTSAAKPKTSAAKPKTSTTPFKPGNNYWTLRLKHGRDRIVQSPEELWENAQQYFQWCIDNPLEAVEIHGKYSQAIKVPKMRVFQKDGLALACGLSEWRLIEDLKKVSADFSQTVTRIEKIISTQKFEGAASGFFNPLLVSRDLGLADQQETRNRITIEGASTEELNDLLGE